MLRTRLRALKVALAICGILVSLYATHVERSKHANPSYQAMCDFSEGASCSRVLTSDASIGFGIVGRLLGDDHPLNLPNTYYGLVVYSLLAVLVCIPLLDRVLVPWIVASSVIVSVYLIYVMTVILKDLCVVCMSTHAVNAALLVAEVAACFCSVEQKGRDKKKD